MPGKPNTATEIYLTATVKGITFETNDVNFKYIGTIEDSGIVSISLPEPGADLTLDFVMRPVEESRRVGGTGTVGMGGVGSSIGDKGISMQGVIGEQQHGYTFVKVKATFNVPTLDVTYRKETLQHSILLPFFTRFFKSSLVDRFETMIQDFLDQGLTDLGEKVTKILNQAPNPLSLGSFQGMVGESVLE